MIIGVDGNEANVEKKVGVSVYTLKLLEYFQKNSSKDIQFKVFLRNRPHSFLPKETEFFSYEVINGPFLWSQVFLPFHLYFKTKIDIYFAPAHYIPRYCPVPIVLTIHDLAFFKYPDEFRKKDLYQLENWTKYSIEKASSILAVSKTTKKDIQQYYHIPEKDIQVIYNGFEKEERDTDDKKTLEKFDINSKKYILFIGTLQPRKNIPTLIKAFKEFNQIYPDFKLVIGGKKGWLYEDIFNEVETQNIKNKVIFPGYVSNDEENHLYKNAFCFVLPSFYEGFGIPILEAMSFNCPVICSSSSSLPEVGGDACLYFDAKDEKDLLEKLLTLKEEPDLYKELINEGKKRIKEFSWKKSAEETLNIIKKTFNETHES